MTPRPVPSPPRPVPVVPKLWPESTVMCIGTGPSLTQEDVDYCRDKAHVIAINDAYKLAPWAEVLYACDSRWWNWNGKKGALAFAGLKYALDPAARRFPGVQVLKKTGETGIETNPTGLRAGRNSGYQAINLAVHLGARRILLLGYDMRGDPHKGDHFFGGHPDGSKPPFLVCLQRFATLVDPLQKLGIEIVNCTPRTKLVCFPQMPLRLALPVSDVVAVA